MTLHWRRAWEERAFHVVAALEVKSGDLCPIGAAPVAAVDGVAADQIQRACGQSIMCFDAS